MSVNILTTISDKIKHLLSQKLTRDLAIDSPETTILRREIILNKYFLYQIYQEWYELLCNSIPNMDGAVLELGSGAGFLKKIIPAALSSEVFACPNIDLIQDARHMPFADSSLSSILMVDVFHHIPDVQLFLNEAKRTLKSNGIISMIEPWNTPWSKLIFTKLHPEPFIPDSELWSFPSSGPLSGANGALPWIVFNRDKSIFNALFPELIIEKCSLDFPFSYLLSGGVSMRSLMPGCTYKICRKLEQLCKPIMPKIAMFAHIVIRKK